MKKLAKIVGIGVGGYAVFNTLLWAYVGVGRYMHDVYTDDRINDLVVGELDIGQIVDFVFDNLDVSFDTSTEGWKMWLRKTFRKG